MVDKYIVIPKRQGEYTIVLETVENENLVNMMFLTEDELVDLAKYNSNFEYDGGESLSLEEAADLIDGLSHALVSMGAGEYED